MSETAAPDPTALVIVHGGAEGSQIRLAVLDPGGVVTGVVLVPANWEQQNPNTRWQPPGRAILLMPADQRVGPGWRRDGETWREPVADPAPAPAGPADGTTDYGEVNHVGPPILVTITSSGQQVEAGRLAGYTPESGHMVKLTRISGQWVVEDRVLLNT